MIFVTVGMHHQGFERLIRAMDELAAKLEEPVIMQIGASSYKPSYAEWFDFAEQQRVEELYAASRVIVSHAGAGTIMLGFQHRRPLVIAPRRLEHGEHVDDHQLELAQALSKEGKVVAVDNLTANRLMKAINQVINLHSHKADSSRLKAAISEILNQEGASN